MTEDPIELVSTALAHFADGDLDGMLALLSDDVVLVGAPEYPGAGEAHGREEVRRTLVEDWGEVWAEMRFDAEELSTHGDRVLVLGRARTRGDLTGVQFDNPMAIVATVQAGAISRFEFFLDLEQARRAAGADAA